MTRLMAGIVAVLLAFGMPAQAHEIGTTKVSAVLQGSSYAIEIATDADALAEKLEAIGGAGFNRDELLLTRLQVAFDGTAVTPSVEYRHPTRIPRRWGPSG